MKSYLCIFLICLTTSMNYAQNKINKDEIMGLAIGENAPDFSALNQNEEAFSSIDALEQGAIIVVFYGGQWCPYCNKHLSELQDNIEGIQKKGAQLIAISPEKITAQQRTIEKTAAKFTLLYDKDYAIAKAFNVLFTPTKTQLFTYNKLLGANLKEVHSDQSQQLPIPATFIINKQGVIVWRHFDSDYKERSSITTILDILSN